MGPRQVAQLVAASRGLPGGGRLTAPCAQVPTHQGPIPLVTERFVEAAHGRGIQVHVWTIDDPAEMARLLDLGVDGLMTDRPQDLKDLLTARGAWVE
jgi:glycerophosphoryl diester phosphodiesterase